MREQPANVQDCVKPILSEAADTVDQIKTLVNTC